MSPSRICHAKRSLLEDSRSLWLPSTIPEYNSPTTSLSFLRHHVAQSVPCVWRGAAAKWTACKIWPKNHHAYLRKKVGTAEIDVAWTPDGRADAIVNVIHHDSQHASQVFAMPYQRKQTFSDMLDGLGEGIPTHSTPAAHDCENCFERGCGYYSAQDSCLTKDVPQLQHDINERDIDFATHAFGSPPSACNMWVGDARSITTTHADPFENLYAVISGCKIFELRPPCDAAFLHKPALKRARWQPVSVQPTNMGRNTENECVLQTEMHFPGWQLQHEEGDVEWIDEGLIDHSYGKPLIVELMAGDLLYLPALWCKFMYHLIVNSYIYIYIYMDVCL